MKRRNLLRGALAAGLTAPALAALTAARTDVDQTLSPEAPQDLADLEAAAESYGYGYHGQAPTRVLADLVTDFTTLRPLLTVPQPAPVRARLCRTAGQMAGMTAIVLHDLGSRRESRAWFATAARAAAESGDQQLHAWVLAREAMVPLNYGAPRAAADLADQARRRPAPGRPPPRCWRPPSPPAPTPSTTRASRPAPRSPLPTPSWAGSPSPSGRTPG
ncbi:hypothetical protein ACIO6T_35980 [Streptomyces sp. NPDC087532]|uniref:hypothetical protein n=2 Tax=Streptomyces TaxID=1883 RepID=UPI003331EB5C